MRYRCIKKWVGKPKIKSIELKKRMTNKLMDKPEKIGSILLKINRISPNK